ncbi:MAG: glycosyltransferase family protein [Vulcanimicrobiaceae bacterium]
MAKIFYGVAGEGRGHATRVRAVVEQLRTEHSVTIFAPDDAFDLLAPLYADTDVRVVRIPGLRFEYNADKAMSLRRTATGALSYLATLPALIARLERAIDEERPDLVVTDFEPSIARAAVRRGVPFVSLDHQHFLVVSDFSHLPKLLQLRAAMLGTVVDLFYSGQETTIVSSFFFPDLRPGLGHVVTVGPMLRPQVLRAPRSHGEHLVVYVRKFGSERLIEALQASGREVRFYGVGERQSVGRIHFFPIQEQRFVDDLASSHALVTTAGNQLLGEALYLQKPVLAFPEPNNSEQLVHGHLLEREGTGEWAEFERVSARIVRGFLSRVEQYRARIVPERMNGNAAALAELRRHLPASPPPLGALVGSVPRAEDPWRLPS